MWTVKEEQQEFCRSQDISQDSVFANIFTSLKDLSKRSIFIPFKICYELPLSSQWVCLGEPKSPFYPLTLLPSHPLLHRGFGGRLYKLAKDQEAPHSSRRMIGAPCFAAKSKVARSRLIREPQSSIHHPAEGGADQSSISITLTVLI